MVYKRDPYKNIETDAYCTAINILAVEYLLRGCNPEEYIRRGKQVSELTENELTLLYVDLALNKHTSTLGAMVTQGDYNTQRENLLWFLDHPEDRDPTRCNENAQE